MIIEYLFSITNYNKDKKRVRLNYKNIASVIYTSDIAKVTNNVTAPFTLTDLAIDLQHALDHRLEVEGCNQKSAIFCAPFF